MKPHKDHYLHVCTDAGLKAIITGPKDRPDLSPAEAANLAHKQQVALDILAWRLHDPRSRL